MTIVSVPVVDASIVREEAAADEDGDLVAYEVEKEVTNEVPTSEPPLLIGMPIRIAVVNTGTRGSPSDVLVGSLIEVGPDLVSLALFDRETLFSVPVLGEEDEALVVFMCEDMVVALMVLLFDSCSVSRLDV